jgi:glycosyltransferase involved in cell wall biosynthesis
VCAAEKQAVNAKLAIISSHVIQYLAPVYRAITHLGQVDLRVLYLCDAGATPFKDSGFGREVQWDIDLLSGYDSVILEPGKFMGDKSFWQIDSPHCNYELGSFDPDVILICGYASRLQWRAWNWGRRRGKPILYFSDSNIVDTPAWWKRLPKQLILRGYFHEISRFLSVGERNAEYLRYYGVPPERILRCPYGLDVSLFDAALESAGPCSRDSVRCRYGIPGDGFLLVYSGKMIGRKRPVDVVDAIADLSQNGVVAHALMLGVGELLDAAKRRAVEKGVDEQVHWAGFVNQSQIPACYAAADALVMTSEREAFGQVVPEAAVCRLPIIISDRVGCVGRTDAARAGENAIVYSCGDVKALTAAIRYLIEHPEERQRMGQRSREIAEAQDVKVAAQAIVDATSRVVAD